VIIKLQMFEGVIVLFYDYFKNIIPDIRFVNIALMDEVKCTDKEW
jgi:hypothetical protein